jgi:hypothetical protein
MPICIQDGDRCHPRMKDLAGRGYPAEAIGADAGVPDGTSSKNRPKGNEGIRLKTNRYQTFAHRAAASADKLDIAERSRLWSSNRLLNSDWMPITPTVSSRDFMGTKKLFTFDSVCVPAPAISP